VPKPTRVSGRDGSQESADPERALGVSGAAVETVAKRPRRLFSAADKLRLVKEADACLASGERGALEALLRREGIYSSQLSSWRTLLGAHGAGGLAAKKAGRKPKLTEAERLNVQLMKRNAELERKLHVANVLIALQKKAHEVLGLALPESDEET
jgi:transposase-like protein